MRKMITVKDASSLLGIPRSTLYRLSQQGKIKAIHIGGRWYYLKDEIDNYLSYGYSIPRYSVRNNKPLERRTYPRINTRMTCKYSLDFQEGDDLFEGTIRNISGEGLLLCDKKGIDRLNLDDPIKLKVVFENNVVLAVRGRVVRRAVSGYGIKFRNIEKDCQDLITKYVG